MADDVTTTPSPKFETTMVLMVRDTFLWRRKKVALTTLFVSTATWVLLDVYHFTFLTIVSRASMAALFLLFLWGNFLRLLSKEVPELTTLNVSEEFTREATRVFRVLMEETIRWMFRVSAWCEWSVFARTVLGLVVLSYIGSFLDFQTSLFIGCVMSFTIPAFWEKNQVRIRKLGDKLRERLKRAYELAHEKIITITNKKLTKVEKEKKTE